MATRKPARGGKPAAKKRKSPQARSKPATAKRATPDPRRAEFAAALRDVATAAALAGDWPKDPRAFEQRLDDVWNSDVTAMADEIGDPLGLLSDAAMIAQFAAWIREDRAAGSTKPRGASKSALDAALQKVFATPVFVKSLAMIANEHEVIDVWEDYRMNHLLRDLKKVMPPAAFATTRKQLLSDMAVEEHACQAFVEAWRTRSD
jgi:hypothetical protein